MHLEKNKRIYLVFPSVFTTFAAATTKLNPTKNISDELHLCNHCAGSVVQDVQQQKITIA